MKGPEVVHVSVGQIRQRIFEEARSGQTGEGRRPEQGAILGTIFHRAAFALVNSQSEVCWQKLMSADELDQWQRLSRSAYLHVIGPELMQRRGALDSASEKVLILWKAIREFAPWLCGILKEAYDHGLISYDVRKETWSGTEGLIQCEQELAREFHEPGWRCRVLVTGRADLLLRVRRNSAWCVVELKLGPGCPEADLAQACLYHELLFGCDSPPGSLALVRFGEVKEEIVFSESQLAGARSALRALIGRVAGATGRATPPPPPPSTGWPKPPQSRDRETARRLQAAFEEFRTPVGLAAEPLVGPAFVRYVVEPARRVSVKQVMNQGVNVQVRLGLARPPLIHLVEGRVAVDVERHDRETVLFSQVRGLLPQPDSATGNARLLAGIDFDGRPRFVDLNENPHILVGGTTGSGKTEWLRSAIASLAATNTPQTLRLMLIDPKRNAFADLKGSPFLCEPVGLLYPPDDDVIRALLEMVQEMERRYLLFEKEHADHLPEYVSRTGESLPRIVSVCDEFADLVMTSRRTREELETTVMRLGQKARAAGIHLILATQRPSRTVVTGVLKANLPCRVALRVTEALESRIILDRRGAENLLGRGDLLLSTGGDPVRLQSPFLDG